MIVPLSSRDSISSGKADISFDFSSTDTCPRQIPFSVLQACNNAADDLFYSIPDFFPASGKIKMLKTPTYMYIGEVKENLAHGQGNASFNTGFVYVGQWYKGKPHGHGKSFCTDRITYEGSWEQGERHGKGIRIQKTASGFQIFEGNWKNGLMHGPCKWIDTFDSIGNLPPFKVTREGIWEDGKLQGKVKKTSTNGETWEEIWKDGNLLDASLINLLPVPIPLDLNQEDFFEEIGHLPPISPKCFLEVSPFESTLIPTSNSNPTEYGPSAGESLNFESILSQENEIYYTNKNFPNGGSYIGLYKGTEPIMGIMCYSNGDTYGGEFKNNVPQGRGKMTYSNGKIYEGDWRCGKS